jgi:hypothetical protein
MSAIDDPAERARRERVRIKLATVILVAYGYALLGGAFWQPLSGGEPFTPQKLALAGVGLALHALAIYISPRGEPV